MTNDELMTEARMTKTVWPRFVISDSVIRISFDIRHLDFVILSQSSPNWPISELL